MAGISLVDLESAAKSIAEIGRDEVTFDIEATSVTLRTLYPAEEVEVQRYALEAYEDSPTDSAGFLDYCDRFRLAILSMSIIKLGNLDLRDVDVVETGETLESGVTIKVPKDQALRTILKPWDRAVKKRMFSQHNALVDKANHRAVMAIETNPSDLTTQIEFHKARVVELEEEVTRRASEDQQYFQVFYDSVKNQGEMEAAVQNQIIEASEASAPEAQQESAPVESETVVQEPEPQPVVEPVVETPVQPPAQPAPLPVTQSIIPNMGVPPAQARVPVQPQPVQPQPVQQAPQPQRQAPQPQRPQQPMTGAMLAAAQQESQDPLASVRSSFMDADDPQALEDETRRFYANREAARRGAPVEDLSRRGQVAHQGQQRHVPRIEQSRQTRRPPHLAARDAENQVGVFDAALSHNQGLKQQQQQMQAETVHLSDGRDALALPPEPLHTRMPVTNHHGVQLNKTSRGYRNPRFKSRKK